MLTKRSCIVLMAAVNLFLLAALFAASYSPPAAFAQAKGRPGDFALVTAKAQGQSFDVVYVLDKANRRLHAYFPKTPQLNDYAYGGSRDLAQDFQRK